LNSGEPAPIDSRGDHDQDYRVYGHCRGDRHDKPREVQCPRVTLAAMIAAAAFGPRRSGNFANGDVGSGLLGRSSEAWPALAPPDGYFSVT
jgi:hypothetical protein